MTHSKIKNTSRKKVLTPHVPFSSLELKDQKLVSETLMECIKTGELDSFREVLASFIMTSNNKTNIAKAAKLGRRTIYDILDPNKIFNPNLSTISAIIRAIADQKISSGQGVQK